MNIAHFKQLLRDLGYEVTYRTGLWSDCLATGHGETWMGSGRTEEQATKHLLTQMFPSQASQVALQQILDQSVVPIDSVEILNSLTDGIETLSSEESEQRPEQDLNPEPEPEPEPDLNPEPEQETVEPGQSAPEQEPVKTATVPPPAPTFSPTPVRVVVTAPTPPAEPEMTKEEALEVLNELTDEIEDEAAEFGVLSPHRQRLQAADWIIQARAIQETFRTGRGRPPEEIESKVHNIALKLTHLCKIYWPGSILALNVYSTPAQGLQGLVSASRVPTTWNEAHEILCAKIEELDKASYYDDHGWRDLVKLYPAPPRPDKVVDEARVLIEKIIGPIQGHLDEKRGQLHPDDIVKGMEELVLAAHLLRWTRKSCPDQEAWGRAMGALRWCARTVRKDARMLDDVLDEHYVPDMSWPELLGRDPSVNRRKRLQREVLEKTPAPDWPEEDILEWLLKAFGAFNNPQIATMAALVKPQILEFTKADFADADRSARSRLHKLQSILRNGEPVQAKLPTLEELKDNPQEEEVPQDVADPAEVLLGHVRTKTEGKRILFVSNREDPRLQDELQQALKAEVTVKNGGSNRHIEAIVNSVDASRYDLVLMATGFNNHVADAVLCRKTKSEGLPYVRVQKGRRAATIRALARAFKLSPSGNPENQLKAVAVE